MKNNSYISFLYETEVGWAKDVVGTNVLKFYFPFVKKHIYPLGQLTENISNLSNFIQKYICKI